MGCGAALARDCCQQAVWKKPTHVMEKVGESAHMDGSCSGEPLLVFVFRAREWALLSLFVSIGVGLEINLLNLGCSSTWLTVLDEFCIMAGPHQIDLRDWFYCPNVCALCFSMGNTLFWFQPLFSWDLCFQIGNNGGIKEYLGKSFRVLDLLCLSF